MRQAKTFTSIRTINYLILPAAMMCFFLPASGEESAPVNDKKALSTESAVTDLQSAKPRESKIAGLQLPEVKDQSKDKTSTLQKKAVTKSEKQNSETSKAKRTRKTAIEQMSSDDTTKEYAAAIDPNLHYEKARSLALQQKYNSALKELNEALIQNPHFYEARYLGAIIYDKQGRKQDAAKKLKQLLFYKPNYLQARISFGMVLSELGQLQAAEAEYKKAIDLSYMSVEPHYNLANLLTKQSRFKEALSELRICLKLSPGNAAVHNNLGVIYFHQHYVEESEKEFRQASELDPANTTYMHNFELVRSGNKSAEEPSLG